MASVRAKHSNLAGIGAISHAWAAMTQHDAVSPPPPLVLRYNWGASAWF